MKVDNTYFIAGIALLVLVIATFFAGFGAFGPKITAKAVGETIDVAGYGTATITKDEAKVVEYTTSSIESGVAETDKFRCDGGTCQVTDYCLTDSDTDGEVDDRITDTTTIGSKIVEFSSCTVGENCVWKAEVRDCTCSNGACA